MSSDLHEWQYFCYYEVLPSFEVSLLHRFGVLLNEKLCLCGLLLSLYR